VLTCERKGAVAFGGDECARCEAMARVVGPLLALKQEAARGAWSRTVGAARSWWLGRGGRRRRVAVAAVALALPVLLLVPVTFNVGAPARVEGAIQRVIAAPMDGYVRQTRVRPGDSVRKNEVLVELADQDLLLEKRKWESELARHETNFSAALGRSDRAQFAVNFARAAEARAQLDLVEQQLVRARVEAPMDGLVISGDLTQMIGAPVKRGDTLLTLAPRDQYRIIVEVDERDIGFIALGQHGRLALGALPGETLPITVQRITPVAAVTRDGRNVYDVEARLEAGGVAPRHGLQGIAKIETQKRTLGWILSRRIVGWIRLSVWGWLP
jgi:biotin carboxyl carrier protein